MTECLCEGGLTSLHQKRDCKKALRKVKHVLPIQRKGNDGVKNSIDASVIPIPESAFKSMFLNQDASKRLHAIYDIKNTAFEPQDGTQKDWEDGTSSKIEDGQLQFTFVVAETDLGFIGGSADLECKNPDTYLYLIDGTILGYADRNTIATDKKVFPLPVDRWNVTAMPIGSDSEVAMVNITIYFDKSMDYKNWVVISASEHQFDEAENYEPQAGNLLLGTAPVTTTSIDVEASMMGFGILGNSIPLVGRLPADFKLTSNGTPEAVLTATETPAGKYKLTFAAQTSGDELKVSLAPTTGYVAQVVTVLVP